MTGGIDSGTLMAAFRWYGLPFRGVSWVNRLEERELRPVADLAGHAAEHTYMRVGPVYDDARTAASIADRNVGGYRGPLTADRPHASAFQPGWWCLRARVRGRDRARVLQRAPISDPPDDSIRAAESIRLQHEAQTRGWIQATRPGGL